jgi:type I restriction enzyme S subunit
MHTIYNDLKKNKWYDYKDRRFSALEKEIKIEEYYQGYFVPAKAQLDKLFRLLSNATEAKSEIIATLYAVWNNFIIEGKSVTDKELIEAFYRWSERKHQYTKEQILRGLQWLRDNHMEPTGFGKLIKKAKGKK